MVYRAVLTVLLAAPAHAAVVEFAALSSVAEVRLAPAPALASSVMPSAALAPLLPPAAVYFAAGAPTPAPLTAASAAAVPAAAAPAGARAAPFAAAPMISRAAPRRPETIEQVSARMRADAVRLGREFKTMEWRDGENYFGYGDRAPARIYRAVPGPNGRAVLAGRNAVRGIPNGKKLPYVLTSDGAFDVGVPRDARESGVKHLQIADGREVVFAGEIGRVHGRLVIDLNSGTFSTYGLDPRWAYTLRNMTLLKDYASALLGEPVDVVAHRGLN